MDILRKELNAIYEAQHLNPATLDRQAVAGAQRLLADWVRVSNACMVLTDASADSACLFTGHLGQLLGLTAVCPWSKTLFSADEDLIYNRLHPEDLVEKRMLEYEFFKYVDALPPADKLSYKATCRLASWTLTTAMLCSTTVRKSCVCRPRELSGSFSVATTFRPTSSGTIPFVLLSAATVPARSAVSRWLTSGPKY